MGNILARKENRKFSWRIERFSSLIQAQKKDPSSQTFRYGGYNWSLRLSPRNIGTPSAHLGLFLVLDDASSLPFDLAVYAEFKLRVLDQLCKNHWVYEVKGFFGNDTNALGRENIMSLETFTLGFLLNDNCTVDVEFANVNACKAHSFSPGESLGMHEKQTSCTYAWKIEKFSEIQRPLTSSTDFAVGGHIWRMELYPDGTRRNNSLEIYLKLASIFALPSQSELFVECKMTLLDQIYGNHMYLIGKGKFSEKTSALGWEYPLRDFHDPSNGFIVDDVCQIQVQVTILQNICQLMTSAVYR